MNINFFYENPDEIIHNKRSVSREGSWTIGEVESDAADWLLRWGFLFKDDLTCERCGHDHESHDCRSELFLESGEAVPKVVYCLACAEAIGTSQVVCFTNPTLIDESA